MLSGREFYQRGAWAEKALALTKGRQMSLGLGTTSKFLSPEPKTLLRGMLGVVV